MKISKDITDLVENIDKRANDIERDGGGEKDLIITLNSIMGDMRKIMEASSPQEINYFCKRYPGFYRYIRLLQILSKKINIRPKMQKF